jgi:hypothetical protein
LAFRPDDVAGIERESGEKPLGQKRETAKRRPKERQTVLTRRDQFSFWIERHRVYAVLAHSKGCRNKSFHELRLGYTGGAAVTPKMRTPARKPRLTSASPKLRNSPFLIFLYPPPGGSPVLCASSLPLIWHASGEATKIIADRNHRAYASQA